MQNNQRILSIDAFRGIPIFVMVFVNDLAGTPDIPVWMGHMPANADAMSFVDLVFPAFLFIAGMSVPFALQNRIQKGGGFLQLQGHIVWRALGLLPLGFFMVNGEDGYNASASGMPVHLWLLLFYAAAILTWNVYTFKNKRWAYVLRGIGIAGLIALAFGLLYWLTDINHNSKWTSFFKPAATNPLLTYIIPGILFSLFSLCSITLFPKQFRHGIPGIAWSLFFAVAVMYIAKGLNKLRIRMQL